MLAAVSCFHSSSASLTGGLVKVLRTESAVTRELVLIDRSHSKVGKPPRLGFFPFLHQILSVPRSFLHSSVYYIHKIPWPSVARRYFWNINWYFPLPNFLSLPFIQGELPQGLDGQQGRDKRGHFLASESQPSMPLEQEGFITKLNILKKPWIREGRKGSFTLQLTNWIPWPRIGEEDLRERREYTDLIESLEGGCVLPALWAKAGTQPQWTRWGEGSEHGGRGAHQPKLSFCLSWNRNQVGYKEELSLVCLFLNL